MNKEEFHKLEPGVQRVLIAKDVIERINNNTFQAKLGRWVDLREIKNTDTDAFYARNELIGKELQSVLNNSVCQCCAIGGLFASLVCMHDDFKITEDHVQLGISSEVIWHKLVNYFSREQIMLMERAFEGESGYWKFSDYLSIFGHTDETYYTWEAATHYRKGGCGCDGEAQKCMLRIMNNIIENNGTFDPFKK